MINMKFPLDIIWFNSAREVVWTEPDLKPCPSYDCPVLMPNAKALYVLEVNAGVHSRASHYVGNHFFILNSLTRSTFKGCSV